MNDTRMTTTQRDGETEALQARYGLRVSARLSEQSELTTHDVSERLRFARERALDRARAQRATVPSPVLQSGNGGSGVLALGGGPRSSPPWWLKVVSVIPLLALLAGLMLIQYQHVRAQIATAAEIDFDLLVDDLPPAAYTDPGFLEFLKTPRD